MAGGAEAASLVIRHPPEYSSHTVVLSGADSVDGEME